MKMRLGMLMIAVALMGFSPSSAEAQWCGTYSTACGGTGKHFVYTHLDGTLENPHPQCLFLSEEGPWGHDECTPTEDIDPDTYTAAREFAIDGDVDSLLVMRRELGAYLAVNEQRGTVQLLNCTKEVVVANFPLASEMIATLLQEQDY